MNGEKCSICGKPMGNSMKTDNNGIPTHKKCLNMNDKMIKDLVDKERK